MRGNLFRGRPHLTWKRMYSIGRMTRVDVFARPRCQHL